MSERPTLDAAIATLKRQRIELHRQIPEPTLEVILAALETHMKLEHDCDRLDDAILRALDQIVGWCGQPTTDPVEIVRRVHAILGEAVGVQEPDAGRAGGSVGGARLSQLQSTLHGIIGKLNKARWNHEYVVFSDEEIEKLVAVWNGRG